MNEESIKAAREKSHTRAFLGTWYFSRFLLPLASAAAILVTRWGKQNLVFYIALPVCFAVFRLYNLQREQPRCRHRFKRHPNFLRYRHNIMYWQGLEAPALLLLMIFESLAAAIAESRERSFLPYAITVGILIGYGWLTFLGRRFLERARSIASVADGLFTPGEIHQHELLSMRS